MIYVYIYIYTHNNSGSANEVAEEKQFPFLCAFSQHFGSNILKCCRCETKQKDKQLCIVMYHKIRLVINTYIDCIFPIFQSKKSGIYLVSHFFLGNNKETSKK